MTARTPATSQAARRLPAAERRRSILDAARETFLDYGYSARTRDIAQRAGINEALIYQHFSSKEDLFVEAVVTPLEDFVNLIPAAVERVASAASVEQRRLAGTTLVEQLSQAMTEISRLLGVVLFSNDEQGRTFYTERILPLIDHWADVVYEGLDGGWTRHDRELARALVLNSIGARWVHSLDAYFRGVELDHKAVAEGYTALQYNGLLGLAELDGDDDRASESG